VKLEEACAQMGAILSEALDRNRVPAWKMNHFARQVTLPFYRSKGTTYNAWLTGAYTVHFLGLLPLEGSPMAYFRRLRSV
jgi:hypothetical protein